MHLSKKTTNFAMPLEVDAWQKETASDSLVLSSDTQSKYAGQSEAV